MTASGDVNDEASDAGAGGASAADFPDLLSRMDPLLAGEEDAPSNLLAAPATSAGRDKKPNVSAGPATVAAEPCRRWGLVCMLADNGPMSARSCVHKRLDSLLNCNSDSHSVTQPNTLPFVKGTKFCQLRAIPAQQSAEVYTR